MKCEYGCEKDALFILKNGKHCCSKSHQSCIKMREKYSKKANGKKEKNFKVVTINKIKTECRFCGKIISVTGIQNHEKFCYLNPINKRDCPVCGKPVKNYKSAKTCSTRCGVIHFSNNKHKRENETTPINTYRIIAFSAHGEKCILCNEDLLLHVHHIDGDRNNNSPENIIPLCPTHHAYCHDIELWYIVKECIEDYIKNFVGTK